MCQQLFNQPDNDVRPRMDSADSALSRTDQGY